MNKVLKGIFVAIAVFAGLSASLLITAPVITSLQDNSRKQAAESGLAYGEITTDEVYLALNDVRRDNSLPQFSRNTYLDKTAKQKCDDMAKYKYYEHVNPKTKIKFDTYINAIPMYHNGASENLNQYVFVDSTEVVTSWMESPEHKASILDPKYTDVGLATCKLNPSEPKETTVVQHKVASPVVE